MSYEYEFVRHLEATSLKFFLVSLKHRLYHWHGDFEILLVIDGSVMVETSSMKYKLSQNDIFIINPNEIHSLSKTDEHNTILAIQFDPKFCKTYFPELQKIHFSSQHITENTNQVYCTELRKYLLQIVKEYYKKEKCYTLKLMSNLQLMVCSLVENLNHYDTTEKEISNQKKNLDRLNHIILYVKDNYMNKISLKEISEKEDLDMYYLSHFIKKQLGISFQDYLNKVRLERAVELLLKTDMNKLDICIESGFSDYRYLNKMFIKEFGCTATEFKTLNLNSKVELSDPNQESDNQVIHNDKVLEALISNLE